MDQREDVTYRIGIVRLIAEVEFLDKNGNTLTRSDAAPLVVGSVDFKASLLDLLCKKLPEPMRGKTVLYSEPEET
jgi:hypothetical protein